MPIKILQKGNRILKAKAKEVLLKDIGGKKIKNILKKMTEALAERNDGVAIAAPQIGELLRVFIVDGNVWKFKEGAFIEGGKKLPARPPMVFINPVLKKISQKKQLRMEGCLSVQNIYGTIKRAEKVMVEAFDEKGKKFKFGLAGLLAQIVQHEVEHLNGILFTDKAMKLEKIL